MAKSDISVKLGLNSKQFDDNIKNSKRQIRKFKQDTQSTQTEIANSFKGMIKGAGAFSAALVGVNGVSAAFKTLLDSNQNFGDNWNNTLEGCKSVFADFVTHLANADLSSFSANIANAYRAGVESGKAYDQLGNTKMSYGVASARKLDQLSDIDAQLSKETDSDKRKALIAERQQLITELRTFANTLSSDVIKALSSSVNVGLGGVLSGDTSKVFSEDMFVKASEIDLNQKDRDSAKSAAEEFYKGFVSQINPMLKKIDNIRSSISVTERSQDFASEADRQKRISQLNSQRDAELNKINALTTNLSEAERQHLLNYITLFRFSDAQLQAAYNEMQGVYNSNRVISRIEKREPQAEKGGSSGGGSTYTTNTAQSPANYTQDQLEEAQRFAGLGRIKEQGASMLEEAKAIKEKVNIEFNQIGAGIAIPDDLNKFQTERIDLLNKQREAQDALNSSMWAGSEIEGMLFGTDSISKGLQMLALYDTLGAALQKLDGLKAISAANDNAIADQKVAANEKETASAMTAFSAQLMKWFAFAGPFAPVLAMGVSMAAMAGLGQVVGMIPKFATGGIVGGGSVSGDKIPALLNTGEMVLNDRQQTALFNNLNGRESFGAGSGGHVEFEIKGDKLRGILQKNNNKHART